MINGLPKTIFLLVGLVFFSKILFAQVIFNSDSSEARIYKTLRNYVNSKPTSREAFSYTLLSDTAKDGYISFYTKGVTIRNSSRLICDMYSFSDGKYLFTRSPKPDLDGSPIFYRANYRGKFSFVIYKDPPIADMGIISIIRCGVAPSSIAERQFKIYYENKNGNDLMATEQSIFYLLKDDKDFYKEFGKERYKNARTFIRYLIKMNERYKE